MPLPFMPVNRADMEKAGWEQCDFVFVSGDAYVDHPSFAAALLTRLLEAHGFKTGVIPQPDISTKDSFTALGRPRLAFLVSAGAMDSMVSNYTANNKPRSEDYYAHGGIAGKRPDRALIAYTAKIREAYKGVPVLIGGIEASLRRTAHYDYWSNTVRRSVLLDSKADLLMYGMGEHSIVELAGRLAALAESAPDGLVTSGMAAGIHGVRGTVWRTGRRAELPENAVWLPSFQEVAAPTLEGRTAFARSYLLQEANTDSISAQPLIEQSEERFIVQEPPATPLTTAEFDAVMELPYQRKWHPMYDAPAANGKIGVPALAEVQFSLTSTRGCFGACSFCAITFHQGRRIQSRSAESLVREATALTKLPGFKGYIHDVGGPTANFRHDACAKQAKYGVCTDRECLGEKPCPNVIVDHSEYVDILRRLRAVPGVKKVFVRSGIRFDYLMMDADKTFFYELCEHHISGQLKVAPEHVNDNVLRLVRKSSHKVYEEFAAEYARINRELGKKQYLVPYYIAGLPGAGLAEALDVALYLKKTGFVPDQVQDFYPTPGNLATTMYYTGLDPHSADETLTPSPEPVEVSAGAGTAFGAAQAGATSGVGTRAAPFPEPVEGSGAATGTGATGAGAGTMKEVYVARGARERKLQRALLQFNKKENRALVREALEKLGRLDLLNVLR